MNSGGPLALYLLKAFVHLAHLRHIGQWIEAQRKIHVQVQILPYIGPDALLPRNGHLSLERKRLAF